LLLPQENPPAADDNPYKRLWDEFPERVAGVHSKTAPTPKADFRTILALLEKYTSFIPSATPWEKEDERTVPDVSLYDHLRVTAAIAACLDKQLLPDALEQAWAAAKSLHGADSIAGEGGSVGDSGLSEPDGGVGAWQAG
jgi:CRISPR/Cas system-associated protein Cas10 (large subunit of type III CRISPR-Cas system)